MPQSKVWSNVGIDIGVLGVAQSISAITKANPGVATYAGADPVNGDYAALELSGMRQLDGRVVRFANVNSAGNTAELEGLSTVGFDTHISGLMYPLTWPQSMSTVRRVRVSGGESRGIDDSDIHTDIGRELPGQMSPIVLQLDSRWKSSDPALLELNLASVTKTRRAIRIRFPDGEKLTYLVYVSAPLNPSGEAQGLVETTITLYAQGLPVPFAT